MVNPFDIRTIVPSTRGTLCRFIFHCAVHQRSGFSICSREASGLAVRGRRLSELVHRGIVSVPEVVTGLLAWQFELAGKRIKGLLLWL